MPACIVGLGLVKLSPGLRVMGSAGGGHLTPVWWALAGQPWKCRDDTNEMNRAPARADPATDTRLLRSQLAQRGASCRNRTKVSLQMLLRRA